MAGELEWLPGSIGSCKSRCESSGMSAVGAGWLPVPAGEVSEDGEDFFGRLSARFRVCRRSVPAGGVRVGFNIQLGGSANRCRIAYGGQSSYFTDYECLCHRAQSPGLRWINGTGKGCGYLCSTIAPNVRAVPSGSLPVPGGVRYFNVCSSFLQDGDWNARRVGYNIQLGGSAFRCRVAHGYDDVYSKSYYCLCHRDYFVTPPTVPP